MGWRVRLGTRITRRASEGEGAGEGEGEGERRRRRRRRRVRSRRDGLQFQFQHAQFLEAQQPPLMSNMSHAMQYI
jgi:hypothetical protein